MTSVPNPCHSQPENAPVPYAFQGVSAYAIKLATIAAPLVAGGLARELAYREAHQLLTGAAAYLLDYEAAALRKSPLRNRDLPGAEATLGVKMRSVQAYIALSMTAEDAATFWKSAIAGECCFTPEVMESLRQTQMCVREAQKSAAAAGRKRRQEKSGPTNHERMAAGSQTDARREGAGVSRLHPKRHPQQRKAGR
jgi:hypothetical protein